MAHCIVYMQQTGHATHDSTQHTLSTHTHITSRVQANKLVALRRSYDCVCSESRYTVTHETGSPNREYSMSLPRHTHNMHTYIQTHTQHAAHTKKIGCKQQHVACTAHAQKQVHNNAQVGALTDPRHPYSQVAYTHTFRTSM